jgi:hypothetical protein
MGQALMKAPFRPMLPVDGRSIGRSYRSDGDPAADRREADGSGGKVPTDGCPMLGRRSVGAIGRRERMWKARRGNYLWGQSTDPTDPTAGGGYRGKQREGGWCEYGGRAPPTSWQGKPGPTAGFRLKIPPRSQRRARASCNEYVWLQRSATLRAGCGLGEIAGWLTEGCLRSAEADHATACIVVQGGRSRRGHGDGSLTAPGWRRHT